MSQVLQSKFAYDSLVFLLIKKGFSFSPRVFNFFWFLIWPTWWCSAFFFFFSSVMLIGLIEFSSQH